MDNSTDPFDILSKLPEKFYEDLQSKKWQERKEALDALYNLLEQNPVLDTQANYNEMANALKNVGFDLFSTFSLDYSQRRKHQCSSASDEMRYSFGRRASEQVPKFDHHSGSHF